MWSESLNSLRGFSLEKKERDFKTTFEQWNIIVQFLEENPILIKPKFTNFDGDRTKINNLWEQLALRLNSMGHGERSWQKWQMAIGRWKSKVKAKASNLKIEMERTGGGPAKAPPLNPVEERLMAIFGWKSVHGDENVELGMSIKSPMTREEDDPQPSTSRETNLSSPPPLVTLKRKSEDDPAPAIQTQPPKRIRTTTEKSKRFVSLNKMHSETLQRLSNIDANVSRMANSLEEISDSIKRFVDFATK